MNFFYQGANTKFTNLSEIKKKCQEPKTKFLFYHGAKMKKFLIRKQTQNSGIY